MIELPWPPASLSGHNTGHFRKKAPIVHKWRSDAFHAARAAGLQEWPDTPYDIHVSATFYPPDKRSDRVNFPNRMKPIWDGIAEAMGVNDKRFMLPVFHLGEKVKGGKVVVVIGQ